MAVKRIVLPVDGSATAQAAARFAEDIARSEGEVVMVVGVAVPLPPTIDEAASVTAAIRDFMTEQVAAEAGRIRAAGIPAEEIVADKVVRHSPVPVVLVPLKDED